MGFFRNLFMGPTLPALPPILSPWSPQDSIESIFVTEALGHDLAHTSALTRDSALRIPAVKRAHDITCGVLARMPWRQYDGEVEVADQPEWLVNSQTGISPRHMRWGVYSDLFLVGQAVIGFELGGDGLPVDALHIPHGMWKVDKASGQIEVTNGRIDPRYSQRLVWVNLGYGSNGLMNDGHDTLTDSRAIEKAYRDRIANPIAQTTLTLDDDRWDMWDEDERAEFRDLWVAGRKGENGATAMKPAWVKAEYSGAVPTDLFESGRNANRLDVANHAGIPAELLEGSKQGSAGSMTYSNETSKRNELWDYGLARYADAVEGRLSLDDVCASGQSIRVDASAYLTTPTPTEPQTSED